MTVIVGVYSILAVEESDYSACNTNWNISGSVPINPASDYLPRNDIICLVCQRYEEDTSNNFFIFSQKILYIYVVTII